MLSVCVICASTVSVAQDIRLEYVRSIGEKGTEPGQFTEPLSVDVDIEGNLYIVDSGNNRIQKLDKNGEFIRMFGGFGWGTDQFDRPVSVDASYGLDIFITDFNNNRITRLDRNMNFVSIIQLDNLRQADYSFRFPTGLAVSSLGDKFIIDSENIRIVKLDAFNNPELAFGGYSSHGVPLSNPVDIAVFSNKKIFVSDKELKTVMAYDYFGNFIDKYGSSNVIDPGGLSVDQSGRLFVCDLEKNSILIFDGRGMFISEYQNSVMKNPVDVSLHNNMLYVVDRESAELHVFTVHHE